MDYKNIEEYIKENKLDIDIKENNTPDYRYWFSQEKLDWPMQVKWIKSYTPYMNTTEITATGTFTISDVPFKPSLVFIQAWGQWTTRTLSLWWSDWTTTATTYYANSGSTSLDTFFIIRCWDWAIANLTSLNSNWLTLDVDSITDATKIIYICYP